MRKACALLSGGKDSVYATHLAMFNGFDVACFLTLFPERSDSWMFHTPAIEASRYIAKAMGIEQIVVKTSGEKERELADLERGIAIAKERFGVEWLVSGALLSDYQRMRIERICNKLGIKTYTPLWRKNHERYLLELYDHGMRFMIVAASCYGLGREWVGRELSRSELERIIELSRKYGFSPAFEGGEAEVMVLDAPLFRKRLIVSGHVVKKGEYEYIYEIERVEYGEK